MMVEGDSDGEGQPALKDLARRVDEAAAVAAQPLDVRKALGVTSDQAGTPLAALGDAFLYLGPQGRHGQGTEVFRPFTVFGDEADPPPPREMPEEALSIWERCAGMVTEPTARARLHDLCFVARQGNGRDHARAAAEAYLEIAARFPSDAEEELTRIHVALTAAKAAARAIALARATHQDDLAMRAAEQALIHARRALADDAGPGVTLGLSPGSWSRTRCRGRRAARPGP